MRPLLNLYKNSFTGLSRANWWLSIVMMINRCGTMVVPFMTLYLTQSLHYTVGKASLVFAVFGLGSICGGFIGGRLSDKFGFYPIQLITLAGGGLLFFALSFMRSFPLICLFTFLLSVVNDSFRPANSIAIAHYSKEENRTRSYSLNRLAINIGWALGGSLGGFIAAKNYPLLFYIDGCTNLVAAVLLRMVLAPAKQNDRSATQNAAKGISRFEVYKDRNFLIFSFFQILYAYCFFQSFSTLPVYFRQVYHLSERTIGLTMAANGVLIALLEMIIIFKLEGKRHPLNYIVYGCTLVCISFLIFNIFPGGILLALASTLIVTFGEMFSMPFMNTYWISRTTNANRGQYAGLYTVSWSIAQVLGPYSGGQIVDRFGFTALWWVISGVCLVATIGFWLLGRREYGVHSSD